MSELNGHLHHGDAVAADLSTGLQFQFSQLYSSWIYTNMLSSSMPQWPASQCCDSMLTPAWVFRRACQPWFFWGSYILYSSLRASFWIGLILRTYSCCFWVHSSDEELLKKPKCWNEACTVCSQMWYTENLDTENLVCVCTIQVMCFTVMTDLFFKFSRDDMKLTVEDVWSEIDCRGCLGGICICFKICHGPHSQGQVYYFYCTPLIWTADFYLPYHISLLSLSVLGLSSPARGKRSAL